MRYANNIPAWRLAKMENVRIYRCSGLAGSARFEQAPVFSDTPLPLLHTEPQPLHLDNTAKHRPWH